MQRCTIVFTLLLCLFLHNNTNGQTKSGSITLPAAKKGTVISEKFTSTILRENMVGLKEVRNIKIYLPPGYETSTKLYPVVYYFHSMFGNPDYILGGDHVVKLLDSGFATGVVKEFIFVVGDYSSPTVGSLYENSPVSGRWLDHTAKELVPFIDCKFRTIRHRNSRAVVGDFMGGRGALKLAMTHANLFGVVYAMHPVATGSGYLPCNLTCVCALKGVTTRQYVGVAGALKSYVV